MIAERTAEDPAGLEGPIAQPGETMFERNIGHLATRGREVEVWADPKPDPVIGFLAGIDEGWIELAAETGESWFIARDRVAALRATGRTLDDLQGPDARKVRDACHHFQKRMSYAFGTR